MLKEENKNKQLINCELQDRQSQELSIPTYVEMKCSAEKDGQKFEEIMAEVFH